MNNKRIVAKELVFLKHKAFNPQINAVLETKLNPGVVNEIANVAARGVNVANTVQVELANIIDVNLSKGRVSQIANGWNESRFSFILVAEVYLDGVLHKEEIYQGYTDNSDVSGGNLLGGGQVTLNPGMVMTFNRIIDITYRLDNNNNLIPKFNKASSILADRNSFRESENLVVMRPVDMSLAMHDQAMIEHMSNHGLVDMYGDESKYTGLAKFSRSDNEVGGKMLARMLKSASTSSLESTYSFADKNINSYETLLTDLYESNSNDYDTLKMLGYLSGRMSVTSVTVAELSKAFPNIRPKVFNVESYNDLITRQTNQAFQFKNDSDPGNMAIVDNQLNRFQKRIINYLFDVMMSYGYVAMSGSMTNKTLDGSVNVQYSLLTNCSGTVNNNPAIRDQVFRLLNAKLTDRETRRVLDGDSGGQDVEMVYDLRMSDSIMMINLNGHITKVKIPSMCDSSSSSLITDRNTSAIVTSDIKNVVDKIINQTDAGSLSGVNTSATVSIDWS